MKWRSPAVLGTLLLCLLLLTHPAPVAAHANLVRAEPVANTAVPVAPSEVRIWFSEAVEARYSEIAVYDKERRRLDRADTRLIPGESLALVVGLRELPEGTYTVVWKANSGVDGHTTTGSFAFAVGSTPPAPSAVSGSTTEFTTPTPAETLTRWLLILAATTFTGALLLRPLVWMPAIRTRSAERGTLPVFPVPLEARVARRLTLLAGAALALLAGATVVGLILQAAKVAAVSVPAALDATLLSDFLFTTRAGAIWSVRLLLPVVAVMLLGPLFVGTRNTASAGVERGTLPGQARNGDEVGDEVEAAPLAPSLMGAGLGAGYLLTISLIGHGAASPLWPGFSIAMDWVHLLATAVWIGGIAGLVATLPLLRGLPGGVRPLLLDVVSRFSNLALISVVVLTVTGLYSAWLHVGSLDALLPTEYGRALVVKLVLFAGLVVLGAVNLLWVRPRLEGRAGGEAEPAGAILLRLFGRVVRIEVVLGIATLLAVAVMTGYVPAREALAQSRAPKLAQTAIAGDLRLTLTLATLQPGDNAFDILVRDARTGRPVTDAERVALRLNMVDMDMGEAEAVATPRGDGHYVATGPYLAMSGNWTTRVIVRRAGQDDVETTFGLAIGSAANLASTSAPAPPQLPALTPGRRWGLLALVAAGLLTLAGVPLFRRGSGFGTALLMLVPTAAVVGGYLLYTDPGLDSRAAAVEPPNPTVADAASLARGEALFAQNCVACHGVQGRGNGPAAASLNPRPPDFSQPHTAQHSDGYLFTSITNGVAGSAMPAWRDQLNERERWDLVNYLRTLNPLTAGATGASLPPVPTAPAEGRPPAGAAPAPAATGPAVPPASPAVPSPSPAPLATPSPAPPAAATAAPAGAGRLIYPLSGRLWAIPPGGGQATPLTPGLAANAFASDPALSPDGTTLVYTLVVVPPPAPITPGSRPQPAPLPGTDLWVMGADGQAARQLLAHDRPGVLITAPAWTPDGKALIYAYSAPITGPDGRFTGTTQELQRLDIATGERTTLVPQATGVAVSPVAQPDVPAGLAYLLTDPNTYDQSLWVAEASGQGARKLLDTAGAGAGVGSRFTGFSAPRFSPDGKRLVVAASGGPSAGAAPGPGMALGGVSLPGRVARWLLGPLLPQPTAAHGLPKDLWTIAIDGSDLRRLTAVGEDDPNPAWSPDGSQVAFLAGGGLYVVNADGTGLTKISPDGSSGALVWARR